jgi:recombination protein RecT
MTTTQLSPIAKTKNMIAARKSEFSKLLPAHIDIERFERVANNAVIRNPDLAEADQTTLYDSFMRCAQDGLIPDGKEAAITIFKAKNHRGQYVKKAQYMPMVDGLLKLVRQSGELKSIDYDVVREGDEFSYKKVNGETHIEHEPSVFGDPNRPIIGVFVTFIMKDGTLIADVMSKTEIDKVRAASKTGKYGPWADWYDRMAIKTVIRRAIRKLPFSNEDITRVVEAIDRDIDARFDNAKDVSPSGEFTPPSSSGFIPDNKDDEKETEKVIESEPVEPPKETASFDPNNF